MIDPKVIVLQNARAYADQQVRDGKATPTEALNLVHKVCDQLWPPARILLRSGFVLANP